MGDCAHQRNQKDDGYEANGLDLRRVALLPETHHFDWPVLRANATYRIEDNVIELEAGDSRTRQGAGDLEPAGRSHGYISTPLFSGAASAALPLGVLIGSILIFSSVLKGGTGDTLSAPPASRENRTSAVVIPHCTDSDQPT